MSLYNSLMGYNPACVVILPMLGRKPEEYPRFRDCWVNEGQIEIYTRVGGNNRNAGFGEEALYEDPNFVRSQDDEFDSTYATYLFNVPEKWKSDFDLIVGGKITDVSDEYVEHVKTIYPRLAEHGIIDSIFRGAVDEDKQ